MTMTSGRGHTCLFLLLLCLWSRGAVTCPESCKCGEEVVCGKTSHNLTHVLDLLRASNSTLHALAVTRVNITMVTTSTFRDFRLLSTLRLNNDYIETVADSAFHHLPSLTTLELRRNFLKQLTNQTFAGLENLTMLELSWNCFVELDQHWFQHLTSLQVLDLSRNAIELIQPGAFLGLGNLRELRLNRNKLITVSDSFLAPLSSLRSLIMDDNSIQLIEEKAFSSLGKLTRLSLNGNRKLKFIPSNAFVPRTFHPLEELSLKGTSLIDVPVDILKSLLKLQALDLSQTHITVIRTRSFTAQQDLHNLTLDSLPTLSTLEADAFVGLSSLERLVISNNPALSNISWGVFRNLSRLQYLDLHNNGLENMGWGHGHWGKTTVVVDLSGNPVRCDCDARWMLGLLDNSHNSSHIISDTVCNNSDNTINSRTTEMSTAAFTRRIMCHAPPHHHGKCLASLSSDDLTCPLSPAPRSIPSNHDNRLKVGIIAASVTCLFLLACALFLKFRRRVCSACRRQYRYKSHRNHAVNGSSLSPDAMELETTQLEDLDSDTDTGANGHA